MKFKGLFKTLGLILCFTLIVSLVSMPIDVSAATLSELKQQQAEAQKN